MDREPSAKGSRRSDLPLVLLAFPPHRHRLRDSLLRQWMQGHGDDVRGLPGSQGQNHSQLLLNDHAYTSSSKKIEKVGWTFLYILPIKYDDLTNCHFIIVFSLRIIQNSWRPFKKGGKCLSYGLVDEFVIINFKKWRTTTTKATKSTIKDSNQTTKASSHHQIKASRRATSTVPSAVAGPKASRRRQQAA